MYAISTAAFISVLALASTLAQAMPQDITVVVPAVPSPSPDFSPPSHKAAPCTDTYTVPQAEPCDALVAKLGLSQADILSLNSSYTKDVCVIKLDEKKFLPNFKSNVIDIARDAHSEFDYPEDRLFRLGAILSAAKIRKPNDQDHNGDPVRYVIRQGLTGLTTRTTVGRLTGFESHERHYSSTRSTGVGDSGGLIASSLVEFPQFPGANLYFDIPENEAFVRRSSSRIVLFYDCSPLPHPPRSLNPYR
ncbi:hypothetical protein EDB92DRAFT_1957892 [Lactarius akahatsu]|uniref:LysM domain-containing protein n=1 Tax=Lactarius akahatsu TaxID=416441 RepID=A0AAD4L2P3_9AGAM|nr:hypothetical protein EDB92DRAFT_1957892 [Lactarius akahatsu]